MIKPSELTPLSTLALVGLFEETDIPPGVLTLLLGQGGRELSGDLQQRVVPRRDERADADRLVDDAAHDAGPARVHHPARVLSRHPGVVTEHGRGVVYVGARLVQRLAGVQALGVRQLLAVP